MEFPTNENTFWQEEGSHRILNRHTFLQVEGSPCNDHAHILVRRSRKHIVAKGRESRKPSGAEGITELLKSHRDTLWQEERTHNPNRHTSWQDERSVGTTKERKHIAFSTTKKPSVLFLVKEIAQLEGERLTTSKSQNPGPRTQGLAAADDEQHFSKENNK